MSGMTGSFHITTWIIWQFIDGRGHGRKAATTGREDCRNQKRAIKEVTCK